MDGSVAAFAEFLKTWGAFTLGAVGTALGVVGTWLGIRSERRSRKEHRWKEEDRQRQDAERAEADAQQKWCEEVSRRLDAGDPYIHVDESKMKWARRGDGTYFALRTMPGNIPGAVLMRLRH